MSHLTNIASMHTLNERQAVKDFLLSQLTNPLLNTRIQLFEEKETNSEQSSVDPAVLALRKRQLLGNLVKELK